MPAKNAARWLVVALLFVASAGQAQERLHRRVLDAFKPVISESARSTARIYGDGRQVALGAVVRSDGYVVTKATELKGKLEVLTHDAQSKLPAEIVAKDVTTDLALLKIDAKNLPVIAWASDAPAIGSWLATPSLDSLPVAVGVVSVTARKIPNGAALGIRLDDSNEVARILFVNEGSAAERAGLQIGDIIRQVDTKKVKGQQSLRETIGSYQKGDKVELVIDRDGKQQTVEAVLGSMSQLIMGERAGFQNGLGGKLSERREGFPLALQHDTVLAPQQCGGPLVDLDGKAVGLNIARAGRVESYALPAALARETIDKLLSKVVPAADSKLVDKKVEGEKKIQ